MSAPSFRRRRGRAFDRFLFDQAPDALLVYDVESGRFVDANPAAAALFECSTAELIQLGPETFHRDTGNSVTDSRRLVEETSCRVLAGHNVVHEVWLHTLQGRRRCCELRLVHLKGSRGKLVRASYIDVTERLEAQVAFHNSKLQLAELSKRSQAIVENVLEGIVTADADGRIQSFNRAATSIFGYEPQEVVGKNLSMLMPKPDRSRHDRYLARYETTRVPRVIGVGRESMGLHKSGRVFPMHLSVSAIEGDARPTFVGLIRDISEQREAQARIARLAFQDSLTGLPNRSALLERLKTLCENRAVQGGHAVLICADVDHFTSVNDTLGHGAGDALLCSISQKFARCVGAHGVVTRLGGDEFAIVIAQLDPGWESAWQQASLWCQRLLQIARDKHDLSGNEFRTSASLGATLFRATTCTPEELLRQADMAMHQAKAESRDIYRFFDPELADTISRKAALLNDLRLALPRNELMLVYQPQVDDLDHILGAEALVRWKHPRRGMVSPADFIPLAEQSGFINELGLWVLRSACTTLSRWAAHPQSAELTLAVNISANEFRDSDFVDVLTRTMEEAGVDPRRLKLELTESVLTLDLGELSQKLHTLKKLGVGISLDDCGTGYSSIAYLRSLPVDQLKIDRSFIVEIDRSPRDETIVRGVVELSRLLGFSVIAEGVETQAQRERLHACRCNVIQGYLTGRPVDADEFHRLVLNQPTVPA